MGQVIFLGVWEFSSFIAALFPEYFCPQSRTLKQRKILVKGHNKKPNKLMEPCNDEW